MWVGLVLGALYCSSAFADMAPTIPASPTAATPVVYGGTCPAEAAMSPLTRSVVAIDVAKRSGEHTTCSGVLALDEHLVITAGHCLYDVAAVSVVFDVDAAHQQAAVRVDRFEIHPEFIMNKDFMVPRHDMALLHLRQGAPAPYAPVELARGVPIGAQLQVLGYGLQDTNNSNSGGQLCTAPMTVIARLPYNRFEVAGVGAGECSGDSGGPFLMQAGGDYLLAAIVSGASDDCSFTLAISVAPYEPWIRAFLNKSAM